MARSSYIYIVLYASNVMAAFTVKHEMIHWLQHPDRADYTYTIVRVRDGQTTDPVFLDILELL